nr:hypothetical protein CFP56_01785 [Quercus suber]
MEDFKQTRDGCSNCVITPYEDDFEDSAKDTKTKRRSHCDDSDGGMAGPSGEAPHTHNGNGRILEVLEIMVHTVNYQPKK